MASSSGTRYQPVRTLVVFALVVAAMYGVMALSHTWTPRLGLDLRGGTTITLTARNTTGSGSVSATSLELARGIIQQRVDAMGVGETEVTTEGDRNIVVSVPTAQREELVKLVGRTAQLSFRNVFSVAQSTIAATPSPGASGTSGTPTPSGTAPGLPTAPASPTPTAPGLPTAPAASPGASSSPSGSTDPAEDKSIDAALTWTPTAEDGTRFQAWNCGDPVDTKVSQAVFVCDKVGQKYLLGPVIIQGTQVNDASYGIPQNQVSYVVNLDFTKQGASNFTKATTYLAQQADPMNRFAIVLDDEVVSAPSVSQPITAGSAEISGTFTQADAAELANVLKYGALPLAFDVASVENVSATLGGEQLQGGLIAGAIGLALVLIYSFIYYRGLGIIVVGSLALAGAMTYAVMTLLGASVGFALNLPGIAGAIVAIGMTADSFIIYFERIRDEIREGRPLRSAIETGWKKARGTVIISDAVQLLSAVVLYLLAIGSVKGFAFTLGLTTVIDLAIIFFVTKPLMTLLGRTKFFGEGRKGSGLEAEHMGVSRQSLLGLRGRRRPSTTKEA